MKKRHLLLFKKITAKITSLQALVLLSLVYILIVPIFASIYILMNQKTKQGWSSWKLKSDTLDDLKRQS
ncbi:hypothetical protein HYS94_01195 [Candidatus Daviesbacteria bacterium]|nr:hypothetical protein [Candidatus Daviesbacteria bacterium]